MSDDVTVLRGDIRARLLEVPDASVDAIIADPPYGETALEWDRRVKGWPDLLIRVLKPSGSMWVFGSFRLFMQTMADFHRWRFTHEVIWQKHNGTGLHNDRFRRVHEIAAHFHPAHVSWAEVYKCAQYTNDARGRIVRKKAKPAQWTGAQGATVYRSEDGGPRLMTSVLAVRSEHGRAVHPTQKPVDLLLPLIRYACPQGGVVLDPFAGSGSTAIAAREAGCRAILIEKDERFASIAERRVRDDVPLLSGARSAPSQAKTAP